jgi:hypothetical protein
MSEADWNILWDDLHHQGDVGEASYAVVPYLAEYARKASPEYDRQTTKSAR